MATDFWITSGWHLTDKNSDGRAMPSVDFIAAYFFRDEVAPVEESCEAERALHARLVEDPFGAVDDAELAAIKDRDVVHNYQAVLRFRDFLAQYDTIESAYLALIRSEAPAGIPPLFTEQLVQVILRGILDGETDPMQIRAAELLFRHQAVTLDDGRIMVADHATVQLHAGYQKALEQSERPDEVMIDILASENADEYWSRSDMFNTSVDIAFTQPALDALCRVMEKWIWHFLGQTVTIIPVVKIEDENWQWHIGLDADGTAILNDLYKGDDVGEDRLTQILCLFKLTVESGFVPEMQGHPVYMALAMDRAGVARMKPQNLLVNLPIVSQ